MNFKTFLTEQFYNQTLHPRFWNDDQEMDEVVRKKLLDIATGFAEEVGVEEYIEDVQLTGSLANFNYTKFSDLDVHILLPFKEINKDKDLVKQALDGRRWVWNERHNIIIRDHEVELYFQDAKEPHVASGLFSLLNNEWIVEPSFDPPQVDEADVISKAKQIENDIKILKNKLKDTKGNPEAAANLQKVADTLRGRITKMRQDSLEKDGEFGIGNLAFKQLRNTNAIGDLIKLSNKSFDNIYSEQKKFKDYMEEY
jgi:predicted nucleotidyltransferase